MNDPRAQLLEPKINEVFSELVRWTKETWPEGDHLAQASISATLETITENLHARALVRNARGDGKFLAELTVLALRNFPLAVDNNNIRSSK